jgi:hypothetical protein
LSDQAYSNSIISVKSILPYLVLVKKSNLYIVLFLRGINKSLSNLIKYCLSLRLGISLCLFERGRACVEEKNLLPDGTLLEDELDILGKNEVPSKKWIFSLRSLQGSPLRHFAHKSCL